MLGGVERNSERERYFLQVGTVFHKIGLPWSSNCIGARAECNELGRLAGGGGTQRSKLVGSGERGAGRWWTVVPGGPAVGERGGENRET